MSKTVLIPLPRQDFDPSEVAIPWKTLVEAGHKVEFSTPDGNPGEADPIMVTGKGLGLLKGILRANKDARNAYSQMIQSSEFQSPVKWESLQSSNYDGIILPGGHAKKVREYLESEKLQILAREFLQGDKPIAAVCHGVLVMARSKDPATGKSIIFDKQTTALVKSGELSAYQLTRLWMGDYYLTYPETTVEDEVKENLASPLQFKAGPPLITRDSNTNLKPGFIIRDQNYLSARWPGDIHKFSKTFCEMLIG